MINMKAISFHTLATALALAVAATLAGQVKAGGELVNFPENYAEGVHYATVDRGNRRQEMFTSRAAIDAVKNGQPIPSGTVITLVDYLAKLDGRGNPLKDASGGLIKGEISRYVVMEKRTGWGAEYPPELPTFCSATFGCVRTLRRGIAVWSPSALSSQQGRWRNYRLT
jgi:uncharacterized membrane protein